MTSLQSTDTAKGWYPLADRIGVPPTNFTAGCSGRRAVCIHIMDSTLVSTIGWFANPDSRVSAHFGIGQNGSVKQFVSVVDTAYANGLSYDAARRCWVDPTGYALVGKYAPTWELLQPPYNPNLQTVSIEREGHPADIPTPAMVDATVQLLRWLAQQFPSLTPYAVPRTLIGHSNIAPHHRANCPGPNAGLAALALAANAPPVVPRYRTLAPVAIFETPTPRGPIALGGTGILAQGDVVEIEERPDGWQHLKDGRGFLPVGVLEKL